MTFRSGGESPFLDLVEVEDRVQSSRVNEFTSSTCRLYQRATHLGFVGAPPGGGSLRILAAGAGVLKFQSSVEGASGLGEPAPAPCCLSKFTPPEAATFPLNGLPLPLGVYLSESLARTSTIATSSRPRPLGHVRLFDSLPESQSSSQKGGASSDSRGVPEFWSSLHGKEPLTRFRSSLPPHG